MHQFESSSRPLRIEPFVFDACLSLLSLFIPPQLVLLDIHALTGTNLRLISVHDDNPSFHISGDFLTDAMGLFSILFYFGTESHVVIPNWAEFLYSGCFSRCQMVCNVNFESGSNVSRIGDSAFDKCFSLSSISIAASVEVIGRQCFRECSRLAIVTFESEKPNSQKTQMTGGQVCPKPEAVPVSHPWQRGCLVRHQRTAIPITCLTSLVENLIGNRQSQIPDEAQAA
jgi:hypothetical protein